VYGEDTFTYGSGKVHDRRYELMNELIALEILQQRHYP